MTASELRLGNYINTPEGFFAINNVADDRKGEWIGMKEKNCGYYLDACKPILLTEEWLLKFGAEEVGIGINVFEYDRFYLRWLPQYNYWYVTEVQNNAYITKVEYVHEWQNVVFVLNGEELEVKP